MSLALTHSPLSPLPPPFAKASDLIPVVSRCHPVSPTITPPPTPAAAHPCSSHAPTNQHHRLWRLSPRTWPCPCTHAALEVGLAKTIHSPTALPLTLGLNLSVHVFVSVSRPVMRCSRVLSVMLQRTTTPSPRSTLRLGHCQAGRQYYAFVQSRRILHGWYNRINPRDA